MNYIVAITGGIGSGKTTISKKFASLGIKIIDADVISKTILLYNQKVIKIIKNHFGSNVIDKYGMLNRKKIKKIIFNNNFKKKWINNLLHPLIYKKIQHQLSYIFYPYVILVIPLLFESKIKYSINRILVIDAKKNTQINRIIKRDNITKSDAKKIISSQISRKKRLQKADDIIINEDNIESLKKKVLILHKKYLYLSSIKD